MKVFHKDIVAHHSQPRFVIDVGGYLGDYTSEIYNKFLCSILIFEPIAEYAEICRKRFELNPNIKVVQMALGGVKGQATIYKSKLSSSVFRELAKGNNEEVVQVGLLSEFMNNEVDLVKLNCEGAEYDIIYELIKTGWLPKIPEILIQFHGIKNYKVIGEELRLELAKTHKLTFKIKTWELWKKI